VRAKLALTVGFLVGVCRYLLGLHPDGPEELNSPLLAWVGVGAVVGATTDFWAWLLGTPRRAALVVGTALAAIVAVEFLPVMADFPDGPFDLELLAGAWLLGYGVLVVLVFGGIGLVLGALFGWLVGPALRKTARQIHATPDSPPAAAEEGAPVPCDGCGRAVPDRALLTLTPSPGSTKKRLLCSSCRVRQERHDLIVGWTTVLVITGFALLAIILDVFTQPAWINLNLLLLVFLEELLVVPHELGHALGAWLTRMRVFRVYISMGLTLFNGRKWGLWRERRPMPKEAGAALVAPRSPHRFRTRQAVMTACGPLANALLLAVSLWWLTPSGLLAQLQEIDCRLVPGAAFAVGNMLTLASALLPYRRGSYQGVPMSSDGLTLLTLPFLSEETGRQSHGSYFALEAQACDEHREDDEARRWLERWLEVYPDDPLARACVEVARLQLREFVRSRQTVRELLAPPNLNPSLRTYLLDWLASTDLLLLLDGTRVLQDAPASGDGEPLPPTDLLEEASRAVEEAVPLTRQVPQVLVSVLGTRGAILIEQGKMEEGTALLREMLDEAENRHVKAFCHCYLGLASLRKEDAEGCRQHLEAARSLSPQCVFLEGVARERERSRPEAAMVGAID